MKKSKLIKIIASSLLVASILILNPIGVSAEWEHDDSGWHYRNENLYDNDSKQTEFTVSVKELLGQEILKNVSVQNPSFYIDTTSNDVDINSLNNVIQDEINKLKITNSYEMLNVSNYNISISGDDSGKVDIGIYCTYRMTRAMEVDLDTKVRDIVANIAPDSMSQSEKERSIHDWIINNTKYDQSYTIYDPYNTLIKHTGVCEGYSLLAQKMFTVAGIKSIVVEGMADGQAHAWNMVYIDNKWRHVDCTWDDPVSSVDVLRYDYFNITDSQISKDHSWDTSKYPSAN